MDPFRLGPAFRVFRAGVDFPTGLRSPPSAATSSAMACWVVCSTSSTTRRTAISREVRAAMIAISLVADCKGGVQSIAIKGQAGQYALRLIGGHGAEEREAQGLVGAVEIKADPDH